MPELLNEIAELQQKIAQTREFLDLDKKNLRLKELENQMSQPDFWQEQKKATLLSKEAALLKDEIKLWDNLLASARDLMEISQLDQSDREVNLNLELEKGLNDLRAIFDQAEFKVLMRGEYDQENVLLSIYAGAGGDDAQDWTRMLLEMYLRYAEKMGFKVEIIDSSAGSTVGYKSVSLTITGAHAFGYLKSEDGVHRLVRISPFDAEKMRHTSFAMVQVLPQLESLELEEIVFDDKDLRIDTYCSSGPGGQSVNTTYSAVRIVHIPTGITATCQNSRSQLQNKEMALQILKSKYFQYQHLQQEEEQAKLRGEFKEAAWGNQIRSYVLHPYQLVKDHRTDFETSEINKVLDGEIEGFIEAYLKNNRPN